MTSRPPKPYWIDELMRKHEGYPYEDSEALVRSIEHEGRSLRLLVPRFMPQIDLKVTASTGDLSFLLGEQLEEKDEDGTVIRGGDGILMVARRLKSSHDTYWLAVWHRLFPGILGRLMGKE